MQNPNAAWVFGTSTAMEFGSTADVPRFCIGVQPNKENRGLSTFSACATETGQAFEGTVGLHSYGCVGPRLRFTKRPGLRRAWRQADGAHHCGGGVSQARRSTMTCAISRIEPR